MRPVLLVGGSLLLPSGLLLLPPLATAKRLVRGTSCVERRCFQLALLLPRSLLTETALALARGLTRLPLSFEISSAHL